MRNLEGLEPSLVIMMNDSFGNWIKKAMPKRTEDRLRSEVQLAVLKERIRQGNALRRKRRARSGLIAAPVLLAMVISFSVVDLGGDGIEMVEVVNPPTSGRLFINDFGSHNVHVLEDETYEDILETAQQSAADEGVMNEVEGWEIGGTTSWFISREYQINGVEKILTATSQDPEFEPNKDLLEFLAEGKENFLNQLNNGKLNPFDESIVILDGIKCQVRIWEISHPKFGTIKYYNGVPIH